MNLSGNGHTTFADAKSEIKYMPPATVRVSAGAQALLSCHVSSNADVLWRFADSQTLIAINGSVRSGYNDRFVLGDKHEFYHELIIRESKPSDAGVYECIENNGNGQARYAVLLVTGKHLNSSFAVIKLRTQLTKVHVC